MPTSGVLAAGADEVSATIAALFSSHAQAYQALSAQAASFHAQFVQLMNTGASQYALTEAANASPLLETLGQGASGAVNSSVQALTGWWCRRGDIRRQHRGSWIAVWQWLQRL